MATHVYKMPSTASERKQLVEEITEMCARVLGYPTREANIANWTRMEIGELRRCHEKWEGLTKRMEPKGLFAQREI